MLVLRFCPKLEDLEQRICPTLKAPYGAVNDFYSLQGSQTLDITDPELGLLANDTESEGAPIWIQAHGQPSIGNVFVNSDGTFSYTAPQGFQGEELFWYSITNGDESDYGLVTLSVLADQPVAEDDYFEDLFYGVIQSYAPGVLENDFDPSGNDLWAILEGEPSHGNLNLEDDGSFIYTPDPGFVGDDSFTYKASNGTLESNTATVDLHVPLAASGMDTISTSEGTNFEETVAEFSAFDTDAPAQDFTADIDWGDGTVEEGEIIPLGDGNFEVSGTYSYPDDGIFTLTISITDDEGNSVTTETEIVVSNENPQEVGFGGDQIGNEGEEISFHGEYSDPGTGDTHTFHWEVIDAGLQVVEESTFQDFTFIPPDDGTYTVNFTVTDDDGGSETSSAELSINNVEPTLAISGEDTATIGEDYQLDLSVSDPGDDVIQEWEIDWGDGSGLEIITGNPASVTHTYAEAGDFTISATATDEDGSYSPPDISVTAVEIPMYMEIIYGEQREVTITGSINDPNPKGLTITFTGVVNASTTAALDGSFSLTTTADELGLISATFKNKSGEVSEPVSVEVTSSAPVITNLQATIVNGLVWRYSGTIEDESPEGLVVVLNGLSLDNVEAVVAADGTFSVDVIMGDDESGTVAASMVDWWGLESDPYMIWVDTSID